jgi:outer membrane protein OmpA-like peptidoglycan-associated protein
LPGDAPTARLLFEKGGAELSEAARRSLGGVLGEPKRDEESCLTLLAFADVADDASQARRLSLSRALAVRSYLIDKGIRSTRIDVRAMGATESGGAPDRVDLVLVSQ